MAGCQRIDCLTAMASSTLATRAASSQESHMNDWRERAACRDAAQDVFFPTRRGTAVVEIEAAKQLCATCPVQPQCLEFALLTRQDFGVWGGTTEHERRLMLKVVRAKARGEREAVFA
jgi:WhiB family transcriptional regulator, redox-sensing transcriptional regulator